MYLQYTLHYTLQKTNLILHYTICVQQRTSIIVARRVIWLSRNGLDKLQDCYREECESYEA